MAETRTCDRCGSTDVPTARIEAGFDAEKNLCLPCRSMPAGLLPTDEMITLAICTNLILRELRARPPQGE